MGEGHIQKFVKSLKLRLVCWILASGLILVTVSWALQQFTDLDSLVQTGIIAALWITIAITIGNSLGSSIAKPTEYLAQSILHISPSEHLVSAPNLDNLRFGRELVTNLVRQTYDFATVAQQDAPSNTNYSTDIINQIPVAILGVDETGKITLANHQAENRFSDNLAIGQQLDDTLQFLTEDEMTMDTWLREAAEKSLTASKTWQKIEVKTRDGNSLGYFDIALSFNKHSGSGIEILIVFYDHSDIYDEEVNSISFVSMAVHELRSPLTIMRGYIDTFEDEMSSSLTPQIKDDLIKMKASAEQLSNFVSKILNVTRIDQGQLYLTLQEESWNTALPQIIDTLRNRATAYGKTIELRMQPDLPLVAIDRTTITEVVTNLIDNAVKYTPESPSTITVISQVNKDGLVETTVQDHGVGITSSVMPELFSKFQRNHRNRSKISGTGLGLYVSKAIVNAHHGNIWASSKEGQGSTFGFTLLPFSQLAKEDQNKNNEAIIRSSHGWIKNHSMQRR